MLLNVQGVDVVVGKDSSGRVDEWGALGFGKSGFFAIEVLLQHV